MNKYQEVKLKAEQVLQDFFQVRKDLNEEAEDVDDMDYSNILDDEEIDLLASAIAEVLSKGCSKCE